jgi:hypothetical protein
VVLSIHLGRKANMRTVAPDEGVTEHTQSLN